VFTVRTPYDISPVAGFPQTSSALGTTGWVTTAEYTFFDQLTDPLTNPIQWNEHFSDQANDSAYLDSNWSFSDQNHSQAGTIFEDTFTPPNVNVANPIPIGPQSPLGTDRVHHGTQTYRAGSATAGEGKRISIQLLQWYLDHANQENFVTPSDP